MSNEFLMAYYAGLAFLEKKITYEEFMQVVNLCHKVIKTSKLKMKEQKTVSVPIEPHFAGSYRIEYDGKYITLFGKDKTYDVMRFSEDQPIDYEEMVLISCVLEIRNASPFIKEVTDTEIIIDLGIAN